MYSTCLYCTHDLGANTVIETLPVGRRIAFDAAQGRLWVVCRHCAKWNLVPFDTRLESIDAGERLFRDTRVRFSTDNIGIARLKEGLELVRVGPALRPEFAAWRYGDQFGARRKRAMFALAGVSAIGAGIAVGGAVLGVGTMVAAQLGPHLWKGLNYAVRGRKVVVRVPKESGTPLELTRSEAEAAHFVWLKEGGWAIRTTLRSGGLEENTRKNSPVEGRHLITGSDAEWLLAGILASTNEFAGTRSDVHEAVQLLESRTDLADLIDVVKAPSKFTRIKPVKALPKTWRVATEMALHEQSEREALAGELALLEWQWKEADRLAKISDALALPESLGGDGSEVS
ncbi:MAG: hypothetical protein ABIZ70_09815 [Gemmatimonadales bacterium]